MYVFGDLCTLLYAVRSSSPAAPHPDTRAAARVQAEDERSECLGHLAMLARCIDTSDLAAANAVAAAFRDALGFMASSEPLEALGYVLLRAYAAAPAPDGGGAPIAEHVGFMHSTVVVVLEDRRPAAAVQLLLRACRVVAARGGAGGAAEELLRSALAVYERRCALPPASQTCLAALMHCLRDVRALPEAAVRNVAARLRRYATSLPVHVDRVRFPPVCAAMVSLGVCLRVRSLGL